MFIKSLILPATFFTLSVLLFNNTQEILKNISYVLNYSTYIILSIGMLLSIRFNQSRIFFFLLIILTSKYILDNYVISPCQDYVLIYRSICFAIPINIIWLALVKERGFFTFWGVLRFGLIILQLMMIGWLIASNNEFYLSLLNKQMFLLKGSPIPQVAWVLFVLATVILIIKKSLTKKTDLEGYFLITLLLVGYALHTKMFVAICFFFSLSGVILLIAIIQNSFRMAYIDELTGIPARRALKEELLKLGGKYTVAMLDIDFFKKFNDTYGHDVGDEVLKLVASIIKNVSGGGKSFRYGGEEFTVLFPGKGINEVLPRLEELREAIERRGFTIRGKDRPKNRPKTLTAKKDSKKINVTISIGVAERNAKYKTPEEVIKAADTALYRAKKKGRNCVSK